MSCEDEVMAIRKQLEKMTEVEADHTQAALPAGSHVSHLIANFLGFDLVLWTAFRRRIDLNTDLDPDPSLAP